MLAIVHGPSPHGEQNIIIMYKCGATEIVHDRVSVKRLIDMWAHLTTPTSPGVTVPIFIELFPVF